tara:strand:+ start:2962 stop:3240 length:279 start_codon:yes stop_codon:yes gene_type:complete
MPIDIEELISYYARRGDTDMLSALRVIQCDLERQEDPDYEPESDSESEVSIDTEDDSEVDEEEEEDIEYDEDGCVVEHTEVIYEENGFCAIA